MIDSLKSLLTTWWSESYPNTRLNPQTADTIIAFTLHAFKMINAEKQQ